MQNYLYVLKKSREKFPTHKKLIVRIKTSPSNPFHSTIFNKIIESKNTYPEFTLYIHDDYLTINSTQIKNYEAVKLILDYKLWIEIYNVFDFVGFVEEKKD